MLLYTFMKVLGNLMTVKTNRRSFFQQAPWQAKTRNMGVYIAALFSFLIVPIAIYVPYFQSEFSNRNIPPVYYLAGIGFGLLIFAIDELRKLGVRTESLYMHRFAW
jgi:hypothetical protein